MASKVIDQGVYAGLRYLVVEKDGKVYVGLDGAPNLIAEGANGKLLDDIGDGDPEEAIAAFFDSIPR